MKEEEIRPQIIFNTFLKLIKKDIKKYFFYLDEFVIIDCPACKSKNYEFVFKKNSFNFVKCKVCNTLFCNPRPTYQRIINFYKYSDSVKFFASDFYPKTEENRRKLIFQPRAEFIKKFVKKYKIENQYFADIGAGYGTFLEELNKTKIFKNVFGIEPAEDLAKAMIKKKINVIQKSIENLTLEKKEYFNFVTSFELFEHLFSPDLFLKKIHKILKPNGILLLTTLNGEGFDIKTLGKYSKSISPPQHLNFFNTMSIALLFSKCGFEVLEISTPGKLDVDIVKNTVNEFQLKIDDFTKVLIESTDDYKNSFQNYLIKNNLSSHMRIIAQKKY
ncbi:MAG TPA: class I SAM-dependent methyltransferase [bacterium]|nr:class I SAM-dependent methyltransferase [bacterium]